MRGFNTKLVCAICSATFGIATDAAAWATMEQAAQDHLIANEDHEIAERFVLKPEDGEG